MAQSLGCFHSIESVENGVLCPSTCFKLKWFYMEIQEHALKNSKNWYKIKYVEEIWEDVDKVGMGIETSQHFTFVTRSRVLRTVVAARSINFPEHLLRVKSHVGLDALCHLLSLDMFIIRRQLKAWSEEDTVLKESSHFSKVSKLLSINTLGEKKPTYVENVCKCCIW